MNENTKASKEQTSANRLLQNLEKALSLSESVRSLAADIEGLLLSPLAAPIPKEEKTPVAGGLIGDTTNGLQTIMYRLIDAENALSRIRKELMIE